MFGFKSTCPNRSEFYVKFLWNEFGMQWHAANEYAGFYGKRLSQYHFNLSNHYSCVKDGVKRADVASSLVDKFGIEKVCLTVVAHEGYMKDLGGRGLHVGTSLENVIVGILVKNIDVLELYDTGLCRFINKNIDIKWPDLFKNSFRNFEIEDKAPTVSKSHETYHVSCLTIDMRSFKDNEIKTSDAYKRAIEGDPDEQLQVGLMFYENVNYQMAFEFFSKSANNQNSEAMNKLGYMYYHGIGCEKNHELAKFWWKYGAIRGNKKSIDNLRLLI